jgi:hypothetical protein
MSHLAAVLYGSRSGFPAVTIETFGTFRVTAATIAADADGDYNRQGYISSFATWEDDDVYSDWDFRDLYDRFRGVRFEGDGANVPRWVSSDGNDSSVFLDPFSMGLMDDDDVAIVYSIHRPDWITDSSWLRVLKCLGWKPRY